PKRETRAQDDTQDHPYDASARLGDDGVTLPRRHAGHARARAHRVRQRPAARTAQARLPYVSPVSTAADHNRAAAPAAPPLPPPRGPAPAPAEATRERLLQATHELLTERGGGNVSVSEI